MIFHLIHTKHFKEFTSLCWILCKSKKSGSESFLNHNTNAFRKFVQLSQSRPLKIRPAVLLSLNLDLDSSHPPSPVKQQQQQQQQQKRKPVPLLKTKYNIR